MIVIPMAGLSSRFRKAGFDKPKYMLEAKGMTLFEHALLSFNEYFNSEPFLFILLDVEGTLDFVKAKANTLGIDKIEIVTLEAPTRGQAETVYLGLQGIEMVDDLSITIFNIDTFRPGFRYPTSFNTEQIDGYLETFIGEGANWSNVLPVKGSTDRVALTAEKQEISQYCCTGLYYFKSAISYINLFETYIQRDVDELQGGEFYIAPMYNDLIKAGFDIRFSVIDKSDVIFCGVPDEYYQFIES